MKTFANGRVIRNEKLLRADGSVMYRPLRLVRTERPEAEIRADLARQLEEVVRRWEASL